MYNNMLRIIIGLHLRKIDFRLAEESAPKRKKG